MIQQNSPWDNIVEPSTPNHVLYSHLEFEAPISTGVRLFLTGASHYMNGLFCAFSVFHHCIVKQNLIIGRPFTI